MAANEESIARRSTTGSRVWRRRGGGPRVGKCWRLSVSLVVEVKTGAEALLRCVESHSHL